MRHAGSPESGSQQFDVLESPAAALSSAVYARFVPQNQHPTIYANAVIINPDTDHIALQSRKGGIGTLLCVPRLKVGELPGDNFTEPDVPQFEEITSRLFAQHMGYETNLHLLGLFRADPYNTPRSTDLVLVGSLGRCKPRSKLTESSLVHHVEDREWDARKRRDPTIPLRELEMIQAGLNYILGNKQ